MKISYVFGSQIRGIVSDSRSDELKPKNVGKWWLTPQSNRIQKVKAEKWRFLPQGDQLPDLIGNIRENRKYPRKPEVNQNSRKNLFRWETIAFLMKILHPNRSSRTILKIKLSCLTDFCGKNCPYRKTKNVLLDQRPRILDRFGCRNHTLKMPTLTQK